MIRETGHVLFIHSSVDGHGCCFHVLTTKNNTSMNIITHVLCGHMLSILLGIYLEVELSGDILILRLTF
jgi:hypothetical protein